MNTILSSYAASVSELKKNPSNLLNQSGGDPIAILNHNRPMAYLIPAGLYEQMLDRLEDAELTELIEARKHEKPQAERISLDDL
ncbi:MAG: type II toxin-antitoxin system prevent-host-death family antitoxin [Verrucomicrobia bacterium]|nr:type II toxin-antitoxin system prevent-host-death family antitoxin [Verrucomicrobiota bacterium]MCH8513778.1 type II toxin-antitoxin system prevent-host-death family antitoxin [Kiritimatiellia bacterium]